jgi:predicted transcriptional regulator
MTSVMRQVTLRLPNDLADRLKQAAQAQDRSVNGYATAVLAAAVDPELAGDEAARVRERLARAGLLAPTAANTRRRPAKASVARARKRAGKGRPLSDLVSEGRR